MVRFRLQRGATFVIGQAAFYYQRVAWRSIDDDFEYELSRGESSDKNLLNRVLEIKNWIMRVS